MKHETNHTHDHPQKTEEQLTGPQGTDKDPALDPADNPLTGVDAKESQKGKKVEADPGAEQKMPDQS